VGLALLGASLVAAAAVTTPQMRARVDGEIRTLIAESRQEAVVDPAAIARLPEPVQRYLRYTGADRVSPARFARFRFEGEVRLPITGDAQQVAQTTPWMAARGEQYMALSTAGPSYVWDSVWQAQPGTHIDVRDLYHRRDTHIWAIRSDGRVLIDERHSTIGPTYMIRFFAEATQSPTMLLPGAHLRWEPVDANHARAVAQDGAHTARMVCHFAASGELSRCESDDRMFRYTGNVPERWVSARWVMTRSDYRTFGALRVPTAMRVSWKLPGGEFEQLRWRTTEIDFDVREPYPAPSAAAAAAAAPAAPALPVTPAAPASGAPAQPRN
jgi:hypothetical protein